MKLQQVKVTECMSGGGDMANSTRKKKLPDGYSEVNYSLVPEVQLNKSRKTSGINDTLFLQN